MGCCLFVAAPCLAIAGSSRRSPTAFLTKMASLQRWRERRPRPPTGEGECRLVHAEETKMALIRWIAVVLAVLLAAGCASMDDGSMRNTKSAPSSGGYPAGSGY